MEQSGGRPGGLWHERYGMARRVYQTDRLSGDRRGYAGADRGDLHVPYGPGAHDAGIRPWLLAVQAALSDPGAAAYRGQEV